MNETINLILSAGDKFLPEMHFRQPGFTYSACVSFTKKQRKNKNIKQMGYLRSISENLLAFNMIWHMEILKIYLEEQMLIKYYVMKHFILLKIRNMMDIREFLRQWLLKVLINLQVVVLKVKLYQMKN